MNITETLAATRELYNIIEQRAESKLYAEKVVYRGFRITNVEYEEHGVYVHLEEIINHDCPDHESVYLGVDELSMNDDEWQTYLDKLKQERIKREEEKEQQKKAEALKEQERLIKYHQDKLKELQAKQ